MVRIASLGIAALLLAASAAAQPAPAPGVKVWRDADLQRPLAPSGRQPSAETLAGLKRRAEQPTPPGYRTPATGGYGARAADTVPKHAELPPPGWQEPPGRRYAEQPLYPYLLIIQSQRPLWTNRWRPRGGGR